MAFLSRYNHDDVFFRSVTVSLLNLLTERVSIWNRRGDYDYQDVNIPFFYDVATGDERFYQDIFMGDSLNDCVEFKMTEGMYDRIPRGHIRLTDVNINTSTLTSRFIRGEFRKEHDDGKLITYNAPINHIPLDLSYDCKIFIDGELTALKVLQQLITTFYKVHSFSFLFGGFSCKAATGFPENGGLTRAFEHSYGDNTERTIDFSLQVETYLPVINPELEFLKSQRIEIFSTPITPQRLSKDAKFVYDDPMWDLMAGNKSIGGDNVKFIPSDSNSITDV